MSKTMFQVSRSRWYGAGILVLLLSAVFVVLPARAQSPAAVAPSSAQPYIQPRPTTNPSDRDNIPDNAPKPDFVSSARRLLTAPELPDAPDEWISHSLDWVDFILTSYPPTIPEYPVRRAALIRMDDILHIPSAPHKQSVQSFYKSRMERAIEEIEQTKPAEGIQVWKLYNHGFFIRTKSVSFTFDIVSGGGDPDFAISESLIHRLAVQSDATFISHLHRDHADKDVARAFLAVGKPVIAPPNLWSDDPEFRGKLTYPTRSETLPVTIPLAQNQKALKIITYPGHQGATVENNVYLVMTPEGYTVVQTGDQSQSLDSAPDLKFFDQMGHAHQVDIFLPNVWTPRLPQILSSVHPKLVITGHENEMGHVVSHREDYTQTYNRLYTTATSHLVMTWGETYHFTPPGQKSALGQ